VLCSAGAALVQRWCSAGAALVQLTLYCTHLLADVEEVLRELQLEVARGVRLAVVDV
jgi:hypothetical protein